MPVALERDVLRMQARERIVAEIDLDQKKWHWAKFSEVDVPPVFAPAC